MKYFGSILLIVLMTVSGFSQDQTLLRGEIENGGFGGPIVKISQVNGETAVLFGGHGGWLINHKLLLGGGGYGSLAYPGSDTPQDSLLGMGYGGAYVEYIVASQQLIHMSVGSLIGVGGVGYDLVDDQDGSAHTQDSNAFLVLEPSLNINLNINTHFRISTGLSYRYANGVEFPDLTDDDLSGMLAHITFKFGMF